MAWAINSVNDPRAILSGTLDSVSKNGDVYTFEGNSAARFNILTTDGYNASQINPNHDQIAARGYMMSPKDWRDFEATCYVNLTADTEDQMVIYGRGGHHDDNNGGCEGFAYKADLYFGGDVRFAKEQWHSDGYAFDDSHPAIGSIEGKWVGMKFVCWNKKISASETHVMLEIWLDANADNNWQLALQREDGGGWGDQGEHCGGEPDQIGVWGGPIVSYRWDNVDTLQMKWASVREINHEGEFTEGGSNPGGGTSTGGTGDTGTGGGVACYCPPPNPVIVEPTPDPVDDGDNNAATGDCGMALYETTGETDQFIEGPFKTRHYASGKPDDTTKEWNTNNGCPFANMELTMYVTITDTDHDDTISMKFYGPNHDDGEGAWYIADVQFSDAHVCFKYEEPHPDTSDCIDDGDSPGSIMNKRTGIKTIIWQTPSGAHLEVWLDMNGEGVWRKHGASESPGGGNYDPDPDQKVQVRIDAAPGIDMDCVTLQEITAEHKYTGGSGGGGGGTPTPPTPPTPPPSGGTCSCGGNPTSARGAPSGMGGVGVEPPPLVTVSRDFTFIHNVGVDTDDNCTTGNPLEVREPKSFYDPAVEANAYWDMGYLLLYSNGSSEAGVYVNNTSSMLYDKILLKAVVKGIKRTVDALSESCTGTIKLTVKHFQTQVTRFTFTESFDVAGIDVNDQQLIFTKPDNKYRLRVGDMIILQYFSNDSTPSKCIKVKINNKDYIDSINTYMIARTYSGIRGFPDKEFGITLFS